MLDILPYCSMMFALIWETRMRRITRVAFFAMGALALIASASAPAADSNINC
jgi:hypothetical protein